MDQDQVKDGLVKHYKNSRDAISSKMNADIQAANEEVRRSENTRHPVLGQKVSSVPVSVMQHAAMRFGGGNEGHKEAQAEYIPYLQKKGVLEKPKEQKRSNFVGYGS